MELGSPLDSTEQRSVAIGVVVQPSRSVRAVRARKERLRGSTARLSVPPSTLHLRCRRHPRITLVAVADAELFISFFVDADGRFRATGRSSFVFWVLDPAASGVMLAWQHPSCPYPKPRCVYLRSAYYTGPAVMLAWQHPSCPYPKPRYVYLRSAYYTGPAVSPKSNCRAARRRI